MAHLFVAELAHRLALACMRKHARLHHGLRRALVLVATATTEAPASTTSPKATAAPPAAAASAPSPSAAPSHWWSHACNLLSVLMADGRSRHNSVHRCCGVGFGFGAAQTNRPFGVMLHQSFS